MFIKIKNWAKQLKQQIFVLYFAYKDDRMPLFAKILTAIVVAYACSPIDLIPDFIPILGYLDDIILIPLGIYFAIRLIPQNVLEDSKIKADHLSTNKKPTNWIAGSIIIALWILVIICLFFGFSKYFLSFIPNHILPPL